MKTSIFHFIVVVFFVVVTITICFRGEGVTDTGDHKVQPVDAQDEREGEDVDTITEPREKGGNNEQDFDDEESLTREEQQDEGSDNDWGRGDEVQREEEVKEECASGEQFDFDIEACIPNEEKVCDDGKDNDNDAKVDSEDSDCQTNEKRRNQENNEEEEEDIEKLVEEEKHADNEEDNNDKNGSPLLELGNNETMSLDEYITDKAQNSQNLTDIHSAALVARTSNNTNNASSVEHYNINGSLIEEATFVLKCHPTDIQMTPGTEKSIYCTAENKIPEPIELAIGCLGLEGTGVECFIDREDSPTGTLLLKELSDTNFSILISSESSPPVPVGSYPFSINAEYQH